MRSIPITSRASKLQYCLDGINVVCKQAPKWSGAKKMTKKMANDWSQAWPGGEKKVRKPEGFVLIPRIHPLAFIL